VFDWYRAMNSLTLSVLHIIRYCSFSGSSSRERLTSEYFVT